MPDALRIEAAIATIDLAGPLDAARVAELARASEAVAERDDVRVCLLQATPDTWLGWSPDALAGPDGSALIGDPFRPFADVPQATIAVIDAPLRDAGLELALCADIRVAAPGATIAWPGAAGDFPVAGGLQRLARALGRARALEIVLLGDPIDAAAARAWGLVSAVEDDPRAAARALAGRIAERGPIAVRFAKEAVRRGLEMPLDQALRYETDLTVLLQTTDDRAEGVRAFVERRPPRFTGQ